MIPLRLARQKISIDKHVVDLVSHQLILRSHGLSIRIRQWGCQISNRTVSKFQKDSRAERFIGPFNYSVSISMSSAAFKFWLELLLGWGGGIRSPVQLPRTTGKSEADKAVMEIS